MTGAALGYGLLAVRCFRAPAWAGPAVAGLLGFTWILQYLVWHPYWNQLGGSTLMPYTILFGWQALERRDGRAAIGVASRQFAYQNPPAYLQVGEYLRRRIDRACRGPLPG